MCFTDYDPPEFLNIAARKARKPHKCCECTAEIPPGSTYENATGKWEGEIETFATCERCLAARRQVIAHEIAEGCAPQFACPPFGGLWQIIEEMELEVSETSNDR